MGKVPAKKGKNKSHNKGGAMSKDDYVVELLRWINRTDINPEEVQMAVVQRLKYKRRMLSRKLDILSNSREKDIDEIEITTQQLNKIDSAIAEIGRVNPLKAENDIDRLKAKLG